MFNSPMLLDFNSNNNNNNNSNNNQKRSKITKACDNCRRRRVKCDGVPEGCGGCKAAKTQCVYTTSNTKRGPPKGYVEVIEDRLGKIENMLAGIVRKKKVSTSASTSSSRNKANATSDPNHGSVAPGANSDNEDGQGDDDDDRMSTHSSVLVEVKQQPPASPALYPARSSTPSARNIRSGSATVSSLGRHGPLVSRNHSLTTLLPFSQQDGPESVSQAEMAALTNMFDKLGTTSVRTTVPFPWLTPEQSQQYGRNHLQFTLQSLEPPLPMLDRPFPSTLSSDQTLQLLDSFFQRFNTFLPIIHRPTFMKQYQLQQCSLCPPSALSSAVSKVHQATPQEIEAHKQHLEDPVAPISPLLFSALLAVASKVPSTGSKMTAEERQRSGTISQTYFDNARLLLDEFMDVPRVSTVQALCLMSQFHHQGQWKATRSSSYLSMAIRMAHELGLHRDPEALVQGPEADGLRYLWWSMFILDHQFSAWLGLGLMMHGKESDVELPVDPTSSQQNLRGFICMVRLVKILGSVLQHSYSTQSLPPQFGGHDSMVSYIEASLTSWLSNLAPEMRWQNASNVVKRGSPALSMRSPPPIHSTLAETARALSLAREAGEIYPAYLYIVYNTTLILLHRPYIVGAAGSPAAAQSNTICTGSGRAITDIAQGLDMEHCSYVVNRFTLYALLQAGVIHAMNAVYDKRGSQVAMDYYNRTLGILGSFLNCSSYSGGVSEGINVLEQFLATTMKAAADQENSSLDNETQDVYQQENQHYRKKRQLEGPAMTLQHSPAAVQYTPSPLASGSALSYMPSNVLQPMMAPTTLSMMNSSSLPDAIGNDAVHASQYNYFQSPQSQQQTPVDLKEQQKQQQLKIQQQHRLYQQMQAFGPSAVNKLADTKGDTLLEQQQQQQQQLMRQQLQRQQQRQQLEMEMKEQQEANPSLYHQQHQPTLTTMAAPVIPSHRHAMQLLQQQRQQQSHGHMPMTMTGLNQEPMSMGTMGSMMSNDFEYDTTKFWVDFSDSNNGTLNPAQLQQDPMSGATVSRAGGADTQFSGPLWT